jgi:hypothetical protein
MYLFLSWIPRCSCSSFPSLSTLPFHYVSRVQRIGLLFEYVRIKRKALRTLKVGHPNVTLRAKGYATPITVAQEAATSLTLVSGSASFSPPRRRFVSSG